MDSQLRHPNIVQFLGATLEPPDQLIVIPFVALLCSKYGKVTEFVERGSLADVLADCSLHLPWQLRLHMLSDAARGTRQ